MDFKFVLFQLGMSILTSMNCKNSADEMVKEIGVNPKFYPKYYTFPSTRMKKWFNIKQRAIPKFLYCEYYISLFLALLGPMTAIAYICTNGRGRIALWLFMLHVCIGVADRIYFLILSTILKK